MQRIILISSLFTLALLLSACGTTTYHVPRSTHVIVHKSTPKKTRHTTVVYRETREQRHHKQPASKERVVIVKQKTKKKVVKVAPKKKIVIHKVTPRKRTHKQLVVKKAKGHDVYYGEEHQPGSHRPDHVVIKEKPAKRNKLKRREKTGPQANAVQGKETVLVSFSPTNSAAGLELQIRNSESLDINIPNGSRYKIAYNNSELTIRDLAQKKWQKTFQRKSSWLKGETYLLTARDHGQDLRVNMTVKVV